MASRWDATPTGAASGKGYQRSNAKLTPQQRDEIACRLTEGESPRELAMEYGVSTNTIRLLR